jgi:hypothetical protein
MIWNKVPITAMDWINNSALYIANTEGTVSRVEIQDDAKK